MPVPRQGAYCKRGSRLKPRKLILRQVPKEVSEKEGFLQIWTTQGLKAGAKASHRKWTPNLLCFSGLKGFLDF